MTDPHSFSTPESRVKHLKWSAKVDFESRVIRAEATWELKGDHGDTIRFDTKDLVISEITLDGGKPVKWSFGRNDSILGLELIIPLEKSTKEVRITYQTSPDAEALQWLSPQQTADKNLPFLFTQSQAILARSWVPCQDTPGVRFTYVANVTVPPDLLALMSASNPSSKDPSGSYRFEMRQPIPSYLLALAVGDLTFHPISERTGVYAESSVIEKATWEFADLEKMVAAAEELYGPYQWDRYDVLVLPPSFPFGGMENPRLTFATPTILAGDRSLTSLIAHELAHSWSGNLVTNATWNDFWLNEGFTVYFETRIMEKLYGTDYAEMLASLNLQDLHDEIRSLREKGLSHDTRLQLDLSGRNPDEGVTSIAYNKGYFFLRSIEERYGRDKFDLFLRDYFTDNAFGSMTTESFRNYITTYYNSKFGIQLDAKHFDQWILTEGLPEEVASPQADRFRKVDTVLAAWKSKVSINRSEVRGWSTHEWVHFLRNLPEQLSSEEMDQLDQLGNFTDSHNAEIIAVWGVIAIRNNYTRMLPQVEDFLVNTGRRKFLVPLYTELAKTSEGMRHAQTIYKKARPNYHFVATNTFDRLLRADPE